MHRSPLVLMHIKGTLQQLDLTEACRRPDLCGALYFADDARMKVQTVVHDGAVEKSHQTKLQSSCDSASKTIPRNPGQSCCQLLCFSLTKGWNASSFSILSACYSGQLASTACDCIDEVLCSVQGLSYAWIAKGNVK